MVDKIKNDIKENIEVISTAFRDCDDVIKRSFFAGENNKTEVFMVYIDNIASTAVIENAVMTNLMLWSKINFSSNGEKLGQIMDKALSVGEVSKVFGFSDVYSAVLIGDTVLLADKCEYALVVSTKAWPTRGVPEAENEVVGVSSAVIHAVKCFFRKIFRVVSAPFRAFWGAVKEPVAKTGRIYKNKAKRVLLFSGRYVKMNEYKLKKQLRIITKKI